MSKSIKGLRKAGLASLAVTLTLGAGIAAAGSASAVVDFKFDRIGGEDRYDTAALAADAFSGTYEEAILANGEPGSYADALTANYLSGVKSAPILLTRKDSTPKYTLDELKDAGVKKITIVGGEGVVSAAQKKSLEDMGYTVIRVAGSDRFKTNADVIEAGEKADELAVIATGFNFADALGAGPLAFNGHALGLSKTDDIDDDVVDALLAAGVKRAIVLGGATVVSDKVIAELEAKGIDVVERVAGSDRSETSTKLADFAIKNAGFTNKGANVASGYTLGYGADALAGGPLTGKQMRPLLITKDVNNVGALEGWFKANANTLESGIIFGKGGAVSVAAQDKLEKAAQSTTSNQDYAVSGGSAYANDGDVKQYTVTGIKGSEVDIVLAEADQVSVNSANGEVTFKGTNPGGSGNTATLSEADSVITVVNGKPATGSNANEYDVDVTNGSVTFTVSVGAEDFVPVVFNNDGNNTLSLNPDGTPMEDFGIGQKTRIVKDEAGDTTTPSGTVTYVNKDADFFETASWAYHYDSNDQFQVNSGSGTYKTVSMSEFEAVLSVDDTLSGLIYRSDSKDQSTFKLDDVAPTSPAFDAAPAGDGKGGVQVTVTGAPSAGDPAVYYVYRATATQPTITGAPVTCPSVTSGAYAKIGSIDPDATSKVFYDRTAQPPATGSNPANPQYCYFVTTVDEGGQESKPSQADVDRTVAAEATPATGAQAPKFTAGDVSEAGTSLTATYSENLDGATVKPGDFRVEYTPAGSNTSYNLTVTGASETSDGVVTITVVLPAAAATPKNGDVYVVTAQKSAADSNTVGDTSNPQQFQAVGDQLYIQQDSVPAAP